MEMSYLKCNCKQNLKGAASICNTILRELKTHEAFLFSTTTRSGYIHLKT